jgi:protocadherin delta 1
MHIENYYYSLCYKKAPNKIVNLLIKEKATPGTRLIRVHATDRDDGLNGHVKYTFIDASLKSERSEQQSQQSIQIKNLFQIDENSGWISVHPSTSLDYEQIPAYRFTVRAQDQGLTNSMPVFANVIIYLNDVNDNPPRISLTLPSTIDDFSTANYEAKEQKQPIASMEISEWTMPNTFLAQVTIDDLDSGLNGKLNISMSQQKKSSTSGWLPSSDFSLVHLFSNIYSLMTKERLDREAFDVYSLEIAVRDAGEPAQTTLHRLTIRVRDENDNGPVFVNSEHQEIKSYEFNLFEMKLNEEEKEDSWVEIGRVQAADADTGLNGKVGYELLVAENSTSNCSQVGRFEVDPASGWLKAKKSSLDREVCETFEFMVVAVDNDGGTVSNRVEARLVVNLLDVNDNRPVFEEDVYRFEIVENLEAIKFGEVKARDADAAGSPYSLVKYKFVEGLSTKEFFAIDEITGELYLLKVSLVFMI